MTCEYFGVCGSCTLGELSYEEQLEKKIQRETARFSDLWESDFDIIKSEDGAFRNRAEFRIWKTFEDDDTVSLSYAMNDREKNTLQINACSIVSDAIAKLMPVLLAQLQADDDLKSKLFSAEFLSSTTADILVTLIYHRALDTQWSLKAKALEEKLNIKIIGRSRKQKVVLTDDCIEETLSIGNKDFHFIYKEGGFTQPNQKVNMQMIEWVLDNITAKNDLCELYCGGGNFTIPLSQKFDRVIATEISKTSIKSAQENCALNGIENIEFVRMSSEEFVEARNKVREFTRLKDIDLESYNFSTIFLDPPRAGLDETTTKLSQEFENIIYISCNPETLYRDLGEISKTHTLEKFAFFDQFAYSEHIESGVILKKKI